MYLKRLSIQGFKSFANRTAFDYDRGVTAVVGPNGSGKSNVADAIRWVLGEQSSRLLRARRQEDVIFAGAGGRAPVGMAEVVLTLDNAERWLPLDFAEVEIGRRVYRNGDSEYLLNGARVRLRDISDLLLKGDVGQNSYSIMGQGLVDEVLSMSADERRSFLDEAADVKRFRMKVKEAQDRLAANRENTGKLALIVAELAPRLTQLARQAERAGEHRRLAGELMELLRLSFNHRWNEAQNTLVRARAMLDQRSAEDGEAAARVERLREQIHALGEEIRRRRETIAMRDQAARASEQHIAELGQTLALDRQRLELLTQRRGEVDGEASSLEIERDEFVTRTNEAAAQHPTDEEASARSAVEEARASLQSAEQTLSAARTERDGARLGTDAAERQLSSLQSEVRSAQERRAELERQLHRDASARRQLLEELAGYGRNFAEARLALSQAHRLAEDSGADAGSAQQRLARVTDDLRAFETSRAEELRELDYLEGRLEALQRIEAEALGLAAGTRNVLALGGISGDRAASVPGVIGMLARQLQVPAALEVALNAALEHRLHAVLVEDEQVALEAIDRLRGERLGRAQFLPLASMRPGHALNLQREKGVVGVAARLVRCERRFQSVVDTLLGRVIVVESLEAGYRMISRSLGSVVTLDGTFIDPSGVITGGSSGADDGVFARERELDELPERIAGLRERARSGEQQLQQARVALDQLQQRARGAERAFDQARHELESCRGRFERIRDRLPRFRREMDHVRARAADAARQVHEVESRLADAALASGRLVAGREERQAQMQALEAQVESAAARREQAVAALSDATTRLAGIEAARRSQEALRAQQQRALAQLNARLDERREQHRRLNDDLALLEARILQRSSELEQAQEQKAQNSGDSAPDRDELGRLEAHERQVQAQLGEAQAELLQIDRRRLDLEAEVERSLQQVESLRAEMDREGLVVRSGGEIVSVDEVESLAPESAGIQGGAPIDVAAVNGRIEELRRHIRRLGPVNDEAPEDFRELQERHDYLSSQLADLAAAEAQLTAAIQELNTEIQSRFTDTFEQVNGAFGEFFQAFFGGGNASLSLSDPEHIAESGIEIEAQPPGKRLQSLSLLSGGERSLTAVALLFALLTANPSPFCVLDEVDAALDEANVSRFTSALTRLSEKTQFIVITHNRRTVEVANAIYGVSMMRDGISKILSLRLSDLPQN